MGEREHVAGLFQIPLEAPHLEQALTHPSFANEVDGLADNQRLEFLGDAVLELCVSELLTHRFPTANEGELTRMRASLVNADELAAWARSNGLAPALRLGKGALASGLADSTNVLADAVEALVAASYLDGGIETARAVCARIVEPSLGKLEASFDPKSELQQKVQATGRTAPKYSVTDRGGPAHDPWFQVEVRVGEIPLGEGRGRSKRLAERAAAQSALDAEAVDRLAAEEAS